jgi:hypothetical protein
MSNNDINDIVGGSGSYEGYEKKLTLADELRKKGSSLKKTGQMPKGFSFATKDNKYLCLQFVNPFTGSRSTKAVNVSFDESGLYQARDKAWKIKDALTKISSASEFEDWWEREIEGKIEVVNDLKTYREIIQEIEDEYFNGLNIHTKRPRSRDIPNDVATWKGTNLCYFKKLPNWDKHPTWQEFKIALFTYKKGTIAIRNDL